jgi:hypothetical protein
MGRINSGVKGKTFERQLVQIFTEHFGQGFRRTPHSGAVFGGSNLYRAKGQRDDVRECLSSDLICPKNWPFSIEAKSYRDLPFHQLIQGKCAQVDDWISQSEQDANLSQKTPLVIFKLNNKGSYVCLKYNLVSMILNENYIKYKEYVIFPLEKFLEMSKNINILKEYFESVGETNEKNNG